MTPVAQNSFDFTLKSVLRSTQDHPRTQIHATHQRPTMTKKKTKPKIKSEGSVDVVDIREQYPLERKLTLDVAAEIGAPHPYYPGTHVPTVMTVDFMVTRVKDGRRYMQAFNVKSAEEAEDERSLAKLEVQREALERQGIEHHFGA